jgi:hypothetical protein
MVCNKNVHVFHARNLKPSHPLHQLWIRSLDFDLEFPSLHFLIDLQIKEELYIKI